MRAFVLSFMIVFFLSMPLSYGGERIKTETVNDIEREKAYSLILYGARHGNDLETVAILDIEGDDYTIVPYAPDFDYEVLSGLDSPEAIKRAGGFISWHPLYHKSELKRITLSGKVIGYELRPLYYPLSYGLSDVIDIDYRLKDRKVIVRIRLLPQIERMLHNGDRLRERDGD